MARAWVELMKRLGYSRFAAQVLQSQFHQGLPLVAERS
jgi:hypothetical protein